MNETIINGIRYGRGFTVTDLEELKKVFISQFGELPTGGFINPTIESVTDDGNEIEFRCFYDNFDNEDDAWHYTYNRSTGQFY